MIYFFLGLFSHCFCRWYKERESGQVFQTSMISKDMEKMCTRAGIDDTFNTLLRSPPQCSLEVPLTFQMDSF